LDERGDRFDKLENPRVGSRVEILEAEGEWGGSQVTASGDLRVAGLEIRPVQGSDFNRKCKQMMPRLKRYQVWYWGANPLLVMLMLSLGIVSESLRSYLQNSVQNLLVNDSEPEVSMSAESVVAAYFI
ncbi:hypothetical protein ROZALSC1DRAFT_22815, partial [Rozella allomycis CSF55]